MSGLEWAANLWKARKSKPRLNKEGKSMSEYDPYDDYDDGIDFAVPGSGSALRAAIWCVHRGETNA